MGVHRPVLQRLDRGQGRREAHRVAVEGAAEEDVAAGGGEVLHPGRARPATAATG